ncbi:unnamed protein product [Sympodiomycopsis kandeliae]
MGILDNNNSEWTVDTIAIVFLLLGFQLLGFKSSAALLATSRRFVPLSQFSNQSVSTSTRFPAIQRHQETCQWTIKLHKTQCKKTSKAHKTMSHRTINSMEAPHGCNSGWANMATSYSLVSNALQEVPTALQARMVRFATLRHQHHAIAVATQSDHVERILETLCGTMLPGYWCGARTCLQIP